MPDAERASQTEKNPGQMADAPPRDEDKDTKEGYGWGV